MGCFAHSCSAALVRCSTSPSAARIATRVKSDFNRFLQPIISKRLIRRGVPFYERPTSGGETTLRGYGRGRFVSNTAWLINNDQIATINWQAFGFFLSARL